MKLKTRIMTLTIGGLVAILVFFSLLIYVFFVRMTTDAEVRLLWNRAQTILRKPEVRRPEAWTEGELLREFLVEHTMIRIIDPAGAVRSSASNDNGLLKLKPVYRTSYHTRIVAVGTVRRVYIQVPVLQLPHKQQVGVLEVSKSFNLTRGYLRILLVTLSTGTLIGILFAIGAAVLYVRWIYKPVGLLAGTMEEIERSGTFGRLSSKFASGQDEFGRLGCTFNRMISRLEDNYKRQRYFIEDASHELRTPLTVIQSYAGMLRRWGGSDPALREEAVTAIEQEAERLKQLVQGLLQTADGGEGERESVFERLDASALARKTAAELSRSFERSVTVRTFSQAGEEVPEGYDGDDAAGGFWLEGNREKLKQLLIILLDNAIKYSSFPVILDLKLEPPGNSMVMKVMDKGVGIDAEHVPHVFDRFYRVDKARTRQSGGSGLGLSIARRIVEEHKGSISVQSEPGAGTAVTVKLPVKQQDRPPEEDGPVQIESC
jgi:two-component system, OmpR family, sensor histidine kinase ArlS